MDLTIFKEQALANALMPLSLNETRLLQYAVANQIAETCPESGLPMQVFNIKDLCNAYNLKYSGEYSKEFFLAVRSFMRRHFTIEKEDGVYMEQIVFNSTYCHDGVITVTFGTHFNAFLEAKKGNKYLKYKLSCVSTLTTVSAYRIYEILLSSLQNLMFKFDNDRSKELDKIIYIDDLKKQLSLENKYARFSNFDIKVLKISMLQINEKTDIHYSYSIIKKGRTPEKIRFRVKYKDIKIKAPEQAVKPVTTDGFDGFDDIPRTEILSDLEQQLILIDFSKSKADKLILEYGQSLIYQVLETLKGAKNIKSKAGFLISQLKKSKLKNDTKKILDDINEQKQKQHNDELNTAIRNYKVWYVDNKKKGGIGYHDFLQLIRHKQATYTLKTNENILPDLMKFAESYLPR